MDAASIESWLGILIQIPIVAVFIWYSNQMNNRMEAVQEKFMNALDRRDEGFERRNAATIQAIDRLNESIALQLKELNCAQDEHDKWVRENVNRVDRPSTPRARRE